MSDMKKWILFFTLSLFCFTISLSYSQESNNNQNETQDNSKDDGVPPEIKEKYGPLMDKYKTLYDAGKYSESLKIMLDIKKGVEKDLPGLNPVNIQINVALGMTYAKAKDNKNAESTLTGLINKMEDKKMDQTKEIVFVLDSLRQFYKDSGNKIKFQTIDKRISTLIDLNPDLKGGLNNDYHQDQNQADNQKNKEMDNQKMNGAWQKYGPRFDKSYQMMKGGNSDEALKQADQNARDAEEEFGLNSPIAVEAYRTKADIYIQSGKFSDAEAIIKKIIFDLESNKMDQTIEMYRFFNLYRDLYKKQGDNKNADEMDGKVKDLEKNPELQRILAEENKKMENNKKFDNSDQDQGSNNPYNDQIHNIDMMVKTGKNADAQKKYQDLLEKAKKELKSDDPVFGQIYLSLANFYNNQQMNKEAMDSVNQSIGILEKNQDNKYAGLMEAYRIKANLLDRSGNSKEAQVYFEKALNKMMDLQKNNNDPRFQDNNKQMIISIQHDLANIYSRNGMYSEAEKLVNSAIDSAEKINDTWSQLILYETLANTYESSGNNKELGNVYAKMAGLLNQPLKDDNMNPANFYMKISDYYQRTGKTKEADNYLNKAREMAEKNPDQPNNLMVLNHIADVYSRNGKMNEAENLYLWLISAYQKNPKIKKSDFGGLYRNIGNFYAFTVKKNLEAEKYFNLALDNYKRDNNQDIQGLMNLYNDLKTFYNSTGKTKEAMDIFDKIEALQNNSGNNDKNQGMDQVRIAGDKARMLLGQGKVAEGEKILMDLDLQIKTKYGEKSREYAMVMMQEVYFYSPISDTKVNLLNLYEKAIAIFEVEGGDVREISDALYGAGREYRKQKNFDKAEASMKRAIYYVDKLGSDGGVQYIMDALGMMYLQDRKDLVKAEEYINKAIQVNASGNNQDDRWLSWSLMDLGQVYFESGKYSDAESTYKRDLDLMNRLKNKYKDFNPDYNNLYRLMINLYDKTGNVAEKKKYEDLQVESTKLK